MLYRVIAFSLLEHSNVIQRVRSKLEVSFEGGGNIIISPFLSFIIQIYSELSRSFAVMFL